MKIAILSTAAAITALSGCGTTTTTNTASNTANIVRQPSSAQMLSETERPQKIKDQMAARGEQDKAAPTLKIIEPKADSTISSSTVKVSIELTGDLKGYKPGMDSATKMGNHIHIILDNQPYEAYYSLGHPFELRNVADGEHTLRVFPSRPWHESYKNESAFQMVRFSVKNGGADTTKPTTTANGNTMSNANTAPTPEAKDMQQSSAGAIDPKKPLLTYSRPKGEYKDADAIMIDFWLSNARLDSPSHNGRLDPKYEALPIVRIRYSVDGGEPKYLEYWQPIWLAGWTAGKHSIKLELVDQEGNVLDNGGYNSTTREITVSRQ